MKAAVLRTIPGELVIEDVDVDTPGDREVLVRTVAAGVCHSDHHYLVGKYDTPLPTVMGHEAAGVVEAVGSNVHHVQEGDHVVATLALFCGHCDFCLTGRPSLCAQVGTYRTDGRPRVSQDAEEIRPYAAVGAFAEQLLVHESALIRVDADIPLTSAATVGCAVVTGLGSVFNTARMEPGSTVAVIGAGGVGLNVVQGAMLAGARQVITVDLAASKLKMAEDFGATHTVAAGPDAVAEVMEMTGGGVEYAFDAVGIKATAEQAFAMLRPAGTATIIGMIPLGVEISIPGVDFLAEKVIRGSCMGSTRARVDIPRYLDLYRQGRLKLDELISRQRPLSEIGEAMADLDGGEVARGIIAFDD